MAISSWLSVIARVAVALAPLLCSAQAWAAHLAQLEVNVAPFPAAKPDDPTPEVLSFVAGNGKGYAWGHARAFLHTPIAKACAALRTTDVCRDPKLDEFTVSRGRESGSLTGFTFHYVVHRILTIEFDVTWQISAVAGTDAAPVACAARFSKTAGTSFIRLMDGSVLLRARDAATTEVELIEHLDATRSGSDSIKSYFSDFFSLLRTAVHH